MQEVAVKLMRAAPGWVEYPTEDATYLFQYADTVMKIFPGGDWECTSRKRSTHKTQKGSAAELEQFLREGKLSLMAKKNKSYTIGDRVQISLNNRIMDATGGRR